eukprot:551543_1
MAFSARKRFGKILSQLSPNECIADDQQLVTDIGYNDKILTPSMLLPKNNRYLTDYEKKIDSLLLVLAYKFKGYVTTHETRRVWETLPQSTYLFISYYEEWTFAIIQLCLIHHLFTEKELHLKLNEYLIQNKKQIKESQKQKFKKNDYVRIRNVGDIIIRSKNWRNFLAIPKLIHHRIPKYAQNKCGKIIQYIDSFDDPKLEAFGIRGDNIPKIPCYRVELDTNNNDKHTVTLDVLQHWLQHECPQSEHDETHEHEHEHEHEHKSIAQIKQEAVERETTLSPYEILADIAINLLIEKKVITMKELREQIERVDAQQHANFGADIVIRAWKDSKFKNRLINDTMNVLHENGYDTGIGEPCVLRIVENKNDLHNLICCTLCSCYPRNILGIPPDWYKHKKFRSMAVSKPRELLKDEFGLIIPDNMKLKVHDSNNEVRYMILPHESQIPNWKYMKEEELKKLITRDMLIGVAR